MVSEKTTDDLRGFVGTGVRTHTVPGPDIFSK
jgi:hypothetical protein